MRKINNTTILNFLTFSFHREIKLTLLRDVEKEINTLQGVEVQDPITINLRANIQQQMREETSDEEI